MKKFISRYGKMTLVALFGLCIFLFGIVVIHKPYVTKSRTNSFSGLPTTLA